LRAVKYVDRSLFLCISAQERELVGEIAFDRFGPEDLKDEILLLSLSLLLFGRCSGAVVATMVNLVENGHQTEGNPFLFSRPILSVV